MRLTIWLNIFISTLLCQERLDMLIKEVLSGSNDSAAIYLPMLEEQYPYNPNMLFLKGLMQTNGEEAMRIFVAEQTPPDYTNTEDMKNQWKQMMDAILEVSQDPKYQKLGIDPNTMVTNKPKSPPPDKKTLRKNRE